MLNRIRILQGIAADFPGTPHAKKSNAATAFLYHK
jgi:hypothetical protein